MSNFLSFGSVTKGLLLKPEKEFTNTKRGSRGAFCKICLRRWFYDSNTQGPSLPRLSPVFLRRTLTVELFTLKRPGPGDENGSKRLIGSLLLCFRE